MQRRTRRWLLACAAALTGALVGAAPVEASSSCELSLGDTSNQGMDRAIVRRVTKAHLAQLCDCVHRGAPVDSTHELAFEYIVDSHGEVRKAAVTKTGGMPAVASCMATQIESWSFPGPQTCGYAHVEQTLWWIP